MIYFDENTQTPVGILFGLSRNAKSLGLPHRSKRVSNHCTRNSRLLQAVSETSWKIENIFLRTGMGLELYEGHRLLYGQG